MQVHIDNADKRLPRPRRLILFAAIAVVCGIAMPLLIIEIALRFLPVSSSMRTMAVERNNPIVRYHPNRPFTFSKGWQFAIVNTGRVNNYGFINDHDYTKHDEAGPVIIIGDSYVEAMMVPYKHTVQGRLTRILEGKSKVYSIGISGAQLAQYLAFAQYASGEFHPQAMVFVIVGNDFDESLAKYSDEPGFHHFTEDANSHGLKLERTDYRPSRWKRLLRNSALVRYLWGTVGIGHISSLVSKRFQHDTQYVGNTAAYASEDRLADSRRMVDHFFTELPQRVGLQKSQVVFVLDAMRPHIYSDDELSRVQGSYFDLMRQYFLERAHNNGYEAIDLQPTFISRHRRDGSRFEFASDGHWNEVGHQEAADAIASAGVLSALRSQCARRLPDGFCSAEGAPQ